MYNTNTANTKITVDTSKIKFFGGYNNNFQLDFIFENFKIIEENVYIDKQNYNDDIFKPDSTTKTLDIANFLYDIDFIGEEYLKNKYEKDDEDEIYNLYYDFLYEYKELRNFNISKIYELITFDIELDNYKKIEVTGYSQGDLITVYTKKEYNKDFLTNMFFDSEVDFIIEIKENDKIEEYHLSSFLKNIFYYNKNEVVEYFKKKNFFENNNEVVEFLNDKLPYYLDY